MKLGRERLWRCAPAGGMACLMVLRAVRPAARGLARRSPAAKENS